MKTHLLTSLCLIAATAVLSAREFTDKLGRKMNAEILGVTGDTVALKRDGETRPVGASITLFADADQKFIREWAAANVKYNFDVSYTKRKLNSTKEKSGPEIYITETWNYEIGLRNKQTVELTDLRADYWLFTKADEGKGKGTARVQTSGSTKISVKGGASTSFNTEPVALNKTELKGNFIYIDGTRPRFSDAMGGIVIRVFDQNNREVFKYATDEDLLPAAVGKTRPAGSNSSTSSTASPK